MIMNDISILLNPPFAINEKDNYYDSLSDRLSSYIEYLHDSMFDKILSSDDCHKFTDIRKRILHVLRQYLSGQSGEGSGFPKIIAAWKETGWGKPELKNKIEIHHLGSEVCTVLWQCSRKAIASLSDMQRNVV